jgi:hypothetical protein
MLSGVRPDSGHSSEVRTKPGQRDSTTARAKQRRCPVLADDSLRVYRRFETRHRAFRTQGGHHAVDVDRDGAQLNAGDVGAPAGRDRRAVPRSRRTLARAAGPQAVFP